MNTELRRAAADRATELAASLRDVEAVTAGISAYAAHTLCYGLAGTALLHACLGNHPTATTHWNAASRALGNAPPGGIHTGPGALAASLIIGTGYLPDPGPHRNLLPPATAWLSARAQALARHHQRTTADTGTPWAIYDAMKGLAGIGRVLLAAHAHGHNTHAADGLHAALTTLTRMILTPTTPSRPGWWLAATAHPPNVTVHPSGAATTGLAHGIAGPLALLATAHLADHTVPGQTTAITTAARWLLTWARPGPTWPPYISGDDLDTGPTLTHSPPSGRTRAWCYGVAGIGRTLTLAGQALNDPELHHTGHTAIATLADLTPDQWDTEGPTLCHGTAGILQAASRTRCEAVARQAAAHITSSHHHGRPSDPQANAKAPFDNPGFLSGATGTALALADYTGLLPTTPATPWDCLLLLE